MPFIGVMMVFLSRGLDHKSFRIGMRITNAEWINANMLQSQSKEAAMTIISAGTK
jgi:hypothetical protein